MPNRLIADLSCEEIREIIAAPETTQGMRDILRHELSGRAILQRRRMLAEMARIDAERDPWGDAR